jgi:type II secretory pathway pseudopilin PulG
MLERLRRQDGIAMPLAVGVIMIVAMLSAVLAKTAMNSTDRANEDSNIKHALGAAEAGLQVASYRLNEAEPEPGQCVTNGPATPLPSGECDGHTESVGNHGSYTYYVSQELPVGSASCGDPPPTPPAGAERCITVVGSVKDETRRVQVRVTALPVGTPLYPVQGVLGLSQVRFENSSTVRPAVGSNGLIAFPNTSFVDRFELGPGAPAPQFRGSPRPQTVNHPAQFTLPPAPVGDTATSNQNRTIVNSSRVTYTAATRDLYLDSGTLTLGPGDYNFCRVRMVNGADIVVTGPVRIFMDAPAEVRPGSGCPSGTGWGNFRSEGQLDMNVSGSPGWLQVLMVGWDPNGPYASRFGRCQFEVLNSARVNGGIYAPYCQVHFFNSTLMNGAIAAYQVQFDNEATVNYSSELDDTGRDGSDWARSEWRECRPEPSDPDDPESGC